MNKNLQKTTGQQELIPRSFEDVLKSNSQNFQTLVKTYPEVTETTITKLAVDFLTLNSTGENIPAIARQFAQDIIETRPDWKVEDVQYLFKFIRQRQDLPVCNVFGHKITPLKLMELVVVYENEKSAARELKHKIEHTVEQLPPVDPGTVSRNIKAIIESMPVKVRPQVQASVVDPKIAEAMAEFDRLYNDSMTVINIVGERFIRFDNHMMNCEAFIIRYLNKNGK